jgi:hypothetical protein
VCALRFGAAHKTSKPGFAPGFFLRAIHFRRSPGKAESLPVKQASRLEPSGYPS